MLHFRLVLLLSLMFGIFLFIIPDSSMNALQCSDSFKGFGTAKQYRVGVFPTKGISADFNNDGVEDIVVENKGERSIVIFIGSANADLVETQRITIDGLPEGLASGDYNSDNNQDLVVLELGLGVSVWAGDGQGTFTELISFKAAPDFLVPGSGGTGKDLLAADFNNDTIIDFAVVTSLRKLLVFLGKPDGSYGEQLEVNLFRGPSTISPTGSVNPERLFSADFNEDSQVDLAIVHPQAREVSILYGTGNGEFQQGPILMSDSAGVLGIGDFTQDTHSDIVFQSGSTGNYHLLFYQGDGRGGFTPLTTTIDMISVGANDLAIGDINNDTLADIVAISIGKGTASIALGTTHGLPNLLGGSLSVGEGPNRVMLGDIDGDGDLDIVTLHGTSNTISVLTNKLCS